MTMQEHPSMPNLNEDVISCILILLPTVGDRASLIAVCKSLHETANNLRSFLGWYGLDTGLHGSPQHVTVRAFWHSATRQQSPIETGHSFYGYLLSNHLFLVLKQTTGSHISFQVRRFDDAANIGISKGDPMVATRGGTNSVIKIGRTIRAYDGHHLLNIESMRNTHGDWGLLLEVAPAPVTPTPEPMRITGTHGDSGPLLEHSPTPGSHTQYPMADELQELHCEQEMTQPLPWVCRVCVPIYARIHLCLGAVRRLAVPASRLARTTPTYS